MKLRLFLGTAALAALAVSVFVGSFSNGEGGAPPVRGAFARLGSSSVATQTSIRIGGANGKCVRAVGKCRVALRRRAWCVRAG